MKPETKQWILIVCTALGTGCGVAAAAAAGGCKVWIAIVTGIGAGASAVVHSLIQSPSEKKDNTP